MTKRALNLRIRSLGIRRPSRSVSRLPERKLPERRPLEERMAECKGRKTWNLSVIADAPFGALLHGTALLGNNPFPDRTVKRCAVDFKAEPSLSYQIMVKHACMLMDDPDFQEAGEDLLYCLVCRPFDLMQCLPPRRQD